MTCTRAARPRAWMEPDMRNGRPHGFTLIELMIVMALIALLASIVTPLAGHAIRRAKESTLRQNLAVTRRAIDDYYADHGRYPPNLPALVDGRYLRALPQDPVTGRGDTWTLVQEQAQAGDPAGVIDLHSGSQALSSEGRPYSQW